MDEKKIHPDWLDRYVVSGNLLDVQEALANGAEINSYNADGFTPLILACIMQNPAMLQELIAYGADVNAPAQLPAKPYPPLYYALLQGKQGATLITLLQKAGADFAYITNQNYPLWYVMGKEMATAMSCVAKPRDPRITAICHCIQQVVGQPNRVQQQVDTIQQLLRPWDSAFQQDILNSVQSLRLAKQGDSQQDLVEPIKRLLAHQYTTDQACIVHMIQQWLKEHVHSQDHQGRNLLGWIMTDPDLTQEAKYRLCTWWVTQGVPLLSKAYTHSKDQQGKTVLGWIITDPNLTQEAKYQLCTWLVTQGAKVHTKDHQGQTPLLLAVQYGSPPLVDFLWQNKAVFTKNIIQAAVRSGCLAMVTLLFNPSRVNVHTKDQAGMTALHWAAWYGSLPIARYLVEQRADVDAVDWSYTLATPADLAAKQGYTHIIEFLLQKGALIQDHIMCMAAQEGRLETVKWLVKQGFSIHVVNHQRWTPLHYAAQAGHVRVVQYLLAQGALQVADRSSKLTPLDLAKKQGHTQVIAILQPLG